MDSALRKKIGSYGPSFDTPHDPVDSPAPLGLGRAGKVYKTDFAVFHTDSRREPTEPTSETSEKTITEADLKAQYDAGVKAGKAQSDQVYEDTIKIMQNALDTLQERMAHVGKQIEGKYLSMLSECLKAVFPAMMSKATGLEVKNILEDACKLTDEGNIHIIMHPDAIEPVRTLSARHSADFTLETNPSLSPHTVRVFWKYGGSDIDCKKVADSVLDCLESAMTDQGIEKPVEKDNGN